MTRATVDTTSRNILRRISPDLGKRALDLRAQGLTVRAISAMVGVSKSVVHRYLQGASEDGQQRY